MLNCDKTLCEKKNHRKIPILHMVDKTQNWTIYGYGDQHEWEGKRRISVWL